MAEMNWKMACTTLMNGSDFDKRNIPWKGGAWVGRGLGYVAEVPFVGDFLDGMAVGYAAQRGLLIDAKKNKMTEAHMDTTGLNPAT